MGTLCQIQQFLKSKFSTLDTRSITKPTKIQLIITLLSRSLNISIDIILPALGSTQPLTEMSTRNLPGGKGLPAHMAENITAICELIVWKMWEPISQPYGPQLSVTGIALPSF
jgi:hypothetical protein